MSHSLKFRSSIVIISLVFMLVVACRLTGPTTEVPPPTQSLPTKTMLPSATVTVPVPPTAIPTATPVAIQGGPTLGDSSESKEALYHTPKVFEVLPNNIPIREDPFTVNPSTTTYAIEVNRSDEKLLWRIDWRAKTKDILTENLKSIESSAKINGQVVDLENILADVYIYENASCYYHLIVTYDWPEKTTVFESIVNISLRINIGFFDIDAGKVVIYRYKVTGNDATHTPTPVAPAQSEDIPFLGSADENLTALETGVPDLGVGADSKGSSANGLTTIQYDVLVKEAAEPYVWRTGWCAADTNELKGILSNFWDNLRVNGQEIDLTKTHFGEYPFGQQVSFSFLIVMS